MIEWLIWFEWLIKLKRLFVFNFRSKLYVKIEVCVFRGL